MVLILSRGNKSLRSPPRWPFVLNKDSPQAEDLISFIPAFGTKGRVFDFLDTKISAAIANNSGTDLWTPNIDGVQGLKFTNTYAGTAVDYLDFGDVTLFDGLTELTIAFNVIFSEINTTTGNVDLLRKDGTFTLQYTSNPGQNFFRVASWAGGTRRIEGTSVNPFTANKIHTVVVAYKEGQHSIIEVDGIPQTVVGEVPATGGLANVTKSWGWATATDAANVEAFPGWIYNVQIFDKQLNAARRFGFVDPATRWDLYHELGRRKFYFLSTGGGGGPSIVVLRRRMEMAA